MVAAATRARNSGGVMNKSLVVAAAKYHRPQTCAARRIEAGREALIISSLVGDDLNDVWREVGP